MKSQGNEPTLVTDTIGSAVVIRLNQPAQRNPLSLAVLEEIDEAISKCSTTGISALIFTGAENVFASGADIRELSLLDLESAKEFSQRGQQIFQRISELPLVTIAAINGYCMGGALDLALACDCRIASSKAVFAHPGARLGIITGWGGTQRLPRLIGRSLAIELFCSARRLSTNEALNIGLVSRWGDPVIECALQTADEIHRQQTRRNEMTKRV